MQGGGGQKELLKVSLPSCIQWASRFTRPACGLMLNVCCRPALSPARPAVEPWMCTFNSTCSAGRLAAAPTASCLQLHNPSGPWSHHAKPHDQHCPS
jgi:hypothetical protein